MMEIEDIWAKGNEQISDDEPISSEFIIKSISESSNSISSKLPKIIWMGILTSMIASILFILNLISYTKNLLIFVSIIVLLAATLSIFIFLIRQLSVIKKLDSSKLNLKNVLLNKLKYLKTKFQLALHFIALSVVLATFNINLTMESSDGILEIRKILILSAFYIFIYITTVFFYKLIHSVYIKQLENALFNLEENTLRSFNEELNKHKRIRKIIGIIFIAILLLGIIFLAINSFN